MSRFEEKENAYLMIILLPLKFISRKEFSNENSIICKNILYWNSMKLNESSTIKIVLQRSYRKLNAAYIFLHVLAWWRVHDELKSLALINKWISLIRKSHFMLFIKI